MKSEGFFGAHFAALRTAWPDEAAMAEAGLDAIPKTGELQCASVPRRLRMR
jgi:hypothetical protein